MVYSTTYPWVVRNFTFAAIYFLITTIAFIQLIISCIKAVGERRLNTQRSFLALIGFQTLLRTVYFFTVGLQKALVIADSGSFDIFLGVMGSLPALLFFTPFCMLCYVWASLSHFAGGGGRYVGVACVVVNVAYYLTAGFVYAFLFITTDADKKRIAKMAYAYIVGGFSIILALAFSVYGWRLYSLFWSISDHSSQSSRNGRRNNIINKVGYITIICMICFTFRAISLFVISDSIADNLLLSIFYFVICEQVPSILMLHVYSPVSDNRGQIGVDTNSNPSPYSARTSRTPLAYSINRSASTTNFSGVPYQSVDG